MLGNRTSLKADAVLFATNKIGVMAIECIASFGLKIPDDVALVSFVLPAICSGLKSITSQLLTKLSNSLVNLMC